MNFIEKAKSLFVNPPSPPAKSKRISNPIAFFDAFDGKKTRSLDYPTLRGYDYSRLQERTYEAFWDSIHGRAAIKQMRSLTINTGLGLESQPQGKILNLSVEEIQNWSINTESLWNTWKKKKEVDYSRKNNFNQLESIAALSYLLFAEFFAILRYSSEKNRLNPISIQLINPMLVRQPFFNSKFFKEAQSRGNRIIDGIEINKKGEEIAIFIYNQKKPINKQYTRVAVKGPKSKLTFVLHGMLQEEEGQVRGIPPLSSIVHELSKITDAELFEMETMAANASIAGSIERDADVVNNDKLGVVGKPGWNTTTEQVEISNSTEPAYPQYTERRIERGAFWTQKLEKGEKLKEFDTKRPNLNMQSFIEGIMEVACPAALGIAYEVVKMKFGQNYSASKGTLELTWRNIEFINSNFSSDFNQAIYEGWLMGEIATGRIIAPGYETPYGRAAWENAQWNGLPIPSLNPLQEAKASESLVLNGFSNREHESQRRSGTNFENNIERLKRENVELAEANEPMQENNNNQGIVEGENSNDNA
jgi:capsid protein